MKTLYRIWQNAVGEWTDAIRSRRALVLLLLYLASAACCMYGTISILGRMEAELAQVLQLPESEKTGVVSATLWKSKPFQRMVRAGVRNDLVYNDIAGRHPAELVYAWFAFFCAPLLVVLVAGNRVADDLRSGAVRYSIVRCTRAEWSLGKYFGQATMIACALAVSAVGAWIVAVCRLSGVGAFELLPAMFGWGLRAWIYSLAWLGIALGLSHVCRSGSRAISLGIFAVVLLAVLPPLLQKSVEWTGCAWLENFDLLAPASAKDYLWRRGCAPLAAALCQLGTLGFASLALGYAVFRRRDA